MTALCRELEVQQLRGRGRGSVALEVGVQGVDEVGPALLVLGDEGAESEECDRRGGADCGGADDKEERSRTPGHSPTPATRH
jgi:hypothetical protein